MYKIECKKQFKMPLQVLSYDKRFQILIQKNSKKKVIYIKNEFDNSTFRYRCYNFKESLENSKKFDITYFLCSEIPNILKYIENINILIFQRTTWTIEVENLIYLAKQRNIPIIYDVDDLLYKADYVPIFINHIGIPFTLENTNLYFAIATGYEMVAKKCDAYITTTTFLKKQLEKDFNKTVYVIPNFLNKEQIEESKKIVEKRKENKEKFVIGYFSGSPSHRSDFKTIENDLIRVLEKYPDTYLKIVGFMQLSEELRQYQNRGRVIFKELVPYEQLQYEIGSVDVNIIPLVKNDFNEAKSELKFFESAIVKVPSCIAKTGVYQEFLQDGISALFCEPGEWFDNIEKLYLDQKLRKKIADSAYDKTCQIYLPECQKENIEKMYQSILEQIK